MDEDLAKIIRRALEDARAAGKDYFTQTREIVRAVLKARPDMTVFEAWGKVEAVRCRS